MPHEQVLLEPGQAIAGGWLEIELAGGSEDGRLVVVLEHGPGQRDLVEFAVPAAPYGKPRRLLVLAERPVHRIVVRDELGLPGGAAVFASHRVRRIGALARLTMALSRSPAETLAALGWRLAGKKVRARNRLKRLLGTAPALGYGEWLCGREPVWRAEIEELRGTITPRSAGPCIAVAVAVDAGAADGISERTSRSLALQRCPGVEVLRLGRVAARSTDICDGAAPTWQPVDLPPAHSRPERLNAALRLARADWVLPVRDGDALADGALVRLAAAVQAMRDTEAVAIYGDHDMLDALGRRRSPAFKPDWNEPYFLAYDYIGWAVAVSRAAAIDAGGFRHCADGQEMSDLLLRLSRTRKREPSSPTAAGRIAHLPRPLVHCDEQPEGAMAAAERASGRAQIVREHLAAQGEGAVATAGRHGLVRVEWPLPSPAPLVSLIVPTRDRVDLLRPCVEGLRHDTDYPALEILIADNGSREEDTRRYLAALTADARVRVVPLPGPFNFAAINNAAARVASGGMLGFINNDIEVMEPGWLAELVSHAARPGIGAVGAKLLYEAGTIQHGGVVMGLGGLAGHAHRFFPAGHDGYQYRLQAPQHMAAVTAACLVVSRERFLAVGGFDADAFPIAFNDVDLCLRLERRGWRSLWTPHAVLRHKESASRAHDMSASRRAAWEVECNRLRERWGDYIRRDPHYNESLTREREDFSL